MKEAKVDPNKDAIIGHSLNTIYDNADGVMMVILVGNEYRTLVKGLRDDLDLMHDKFEDLYRRKTL